MVVFMKTQLAIQTPVTARVPAMFDTKFSEKKMCQLTQFFNV